MACRSMAINQPPMSKAISTMLCCVGDAYLNASKVSLNACRIIRKNVSFDDVPGFDRLSGLMIMVGCSFAIALAVQKMRIFVFFGGSIDRLFLLAAGVFAILKWGTHLLFRRRDEPKQDVPKFPGA